MTNNPSEEKQQASLAYDINVAARQRTAELIRLGPWEAALSTPLPDSPCPHCQQGHKRVAYRSLRSGGARLILHNIPPTLFGDIICSDQREPD